MYCNVYAPCDFDPPLLWKFQWIALMSLGYPWFGYETLMHPTVNQCH
jgi:hypothetical protein